MFDSQKPFERRGREAQWVRRGRYAVEVVTDVVYPGDGTYGPCLEPAALRWLDEVARHAEAGDVAFLKKAGRVYELMDAEAGIADEREPDVDLRPTVGAEAAVA